MSNRKLLSTPTPVLPVFINYVTMCLGLYREAWQAVHRVDGLDNANRNYWAKVLTRQINDNIEVGLGCVWGGGQGEGLFVCMAIGFCKAIYIPHTPLWLALFADCASGCGPNQSVPGIGDFYATH